MPARSNRDLRRHGLIWVLLLLFIALGSAFFWNARGDDLASSFVGCRVLAAHHEGSLYSHDPVNFAGIADNDSVWPRVATAGGYHGWLHPYVQTPLWAWGLRPLCTALQWPAFLHVFVVLALCCIAGFVYLTARFWAPQLFSPLALAITLTLLAFSEPFLFAMVLVQTHALLLFLTVAGLVLAERERPVAAGMLVALAAAVKVTPGVVLLYWLANRRWRAAASFAAWSAGLLVFTRFTLGTSLFHEFTMSMHRVANVLLVAENNQSLAAWYMGRFFPPDEVFDVNAFALPSALRLIATALMLAFAALGGWLDWRSARRLPANSPTSNRAHFGAAMTLVAMTLFAPIAWSHYFIVLAIPLIMLVQAARASASFRVKWGLRVCCVVAALLLFRPLAPDVIRMDLSDYAVLRGEFYSGGLCLLACAFAAGRRSTSAFHE